MKFNTESLSGRCLRNIALIVACGFTVCAAQAQPIKWGLALTNINNLTPTTVVTNADGSVAITTGGGDTYGNPDSFAYAYQQVTGDFDIRVQVVNVAADNANGQQASAKGSLMVRESLDPGSYDFMINAVPLNFGRFGEIESIGRLNLKTDTDDLPGRNLNFGGNTGTSSTGNAWSPAYGGDTTDVNFASYPNCWLRIVRQGNMFYSYFASTNTEEYPQNANPGSTNGWQLLAMAPASTDFGSAVYIGLSTVAHGTNNSDPDTVTSTYQSYGPTPLYNGSASIPTTNGVPVPASMAPGQFPTKVTAVNWDVSIPADGLGYPGEVLQSDQGAASQIVWDNGGYPSVSRDVLASIDSESPLGFASARYQCSGFDFAIGPNNPELAQNNLGLYTNPDRERYNSGDPTVPASQAWIPSPNYGFMFSTIHKNQGSWNDQSGPFWAATYIQLDPSATSTEYDMIGGHFNNGQAYTRTTKLVNGDSLTNGAGGNGSVYRCAIPHSVVYFPYAQGWRAGYFDDDIFSENLSDPTDGLNNPLPAGVPMWKHGDGWGLYSGHALDGCTNGTISANYDSPNEILSWLDAADGNYDGLALLNFPGVNSQTDGMLFTIGNDEANGQRGPSANNAALPNGQGWYVAVRDIQTSIGSPTTYATDVNNDAGSSFSFIYIPWNADNLIGGHIRGTNGATIKGAGNYTLTRTSVGHYQLSIPGKTDSDGALMLLNSGFLASQPNGLTNVVDNSFLSYEYGGTNSPNNVFMINAVAISPDDSGVVFQDADFNFVWVDFTNPLAPMGTTQPVLSITQSGASVIISWSNGPGFILQESSSLNPGSTWSTVGTANPSAPILIGSGPMFFRVVSP